MSKEQLHLAEIEALRGEINATLDRQNQNENFFVLTGSGIFGYIFRNGPSNMEQTAPYFAILALLICVLCWRRFWEMKAHLTKISIYLKEKERQLSEAGGWEVYYAESIKGSESRGYSRTREFFWPIAASFMTVAVFWLF